MSEQEGSPPSLGDTGLGRLYREAKGHGSNSFILSLGSEGEHDELTSI